MYVPFVSLRQLGAEHKVPSLLMSHTLAICMHHTGQHYLRWTDLRNLSRQVPSMQDQRSASIAHDTYDCDAERHPLLSDSITCRGGRAYAHGMLTRANIATASALR